VAETVAETVSFVDVDDVDESQSNGTPSEQVESSSMVSSITTLKTRAKNSMSVSVVSECDGADLG